MDDFKQFAAVEDVSDHYFLENDPNKNEGGACPFNASSSAYKKIMREWKLLEEGLPDSIFVRTYETRIDLLRAVIIGAAGTPYHDGLFFFDIAFPSKYPSKPPKVYFRSHGLRINPNLYATGFVCLSLLNTWHGSKKERWNPSQSTILQVLLSIQALVLNEKPYYNEPAAGFYVHGKKGSRAYNEDVFLSSCKLMIFSQRNPPRNFEAFVADHFRRKAVAILSSCEAYANGRVRVGYFRNEAMASSSAAIQISTKFKEEMAVLYPVLVSYFRKNGASLRTSIEQLTVETQTPASKPKKGRIFQKMIEKIRILLGFKKKNDQKNKSIATKVK